MQKAEEQTVNNYEFRIFAMKRSGHHAVMNWLMSHFKGETLLLGNSFFGHSFRSLRDEENRKLWNGLDCVMYPILDRVIENCRHPSIKPSHKSFNLLVIRDPFNAFASRCKYCMLHQHRAGPGYDVMSCGNKRLLRMGCIPTEAGMSMKDVWLSFAKEAVGDTNVIPNKIVVNFNRWFSDREYRVALANTIGVEFTDKDINVVPEFGDGSSFDGLDFNGNAQMMNVLDRWRSFRNNEWFRDFFTDEVLDLGVRLGYGDIVTEYLRATR
jgi:hypothetical protein